MTTIYVDGDACPVKDQVYKAASRRGLTVIVVANAYMRTPPVAEVVVVKNEMDSADDYIAAHAGAGDVVITADIDLAARCVKAGSKCIGHKGKEFTEENIGSAVAMKDLMKHVRDVTGREMGPKPFSERDKRNFMRDFSQLLDGLNK